MLFSNFFQRANFTNIKQDYMKIISVSPWLKVDDDMMAATIIMR
jgi:hypothetical protein